MAVAHRSASESHTGTVGSTSQTSFTWTHANSGTPQGVLVFVHVANSAGNPVSSVNYGGVTLTRVTGGAAVDTAGEAGRTDLFFAGSGLPGGSQIITVNRSNTTDIMYASAATVIAATDTNVTGIVLLEGDGALTVQSVTDGGAPTNSLRYAAAYSGLAAPPPAGTGSTLLNSIDFGNYGIALVVETTAGTGARNVGFNNATTDDRAAVHVAVRELWNRTDTETVGSFTLTGNDATLTKASPKVITGETGSFSLAGQPADLRHNPDIEAGTGAFTLAGQPADTRHNVVIESGTGAFSLAGNDATFTKTTAKAITVQTGVFTFSGNPAVLLQGYTLTAEVSAFIKTGLPVGCRRTWAIQGATGIFAITGNAASFTELGAYEITAIIGALTFTGAPVNLAKSRSFPVSASSFSLTSQPVTLRHSQTVGVDPGEYNLAGQLVALRYARTIALDQGVLTLSGQPVTVPYNRLLTVGTGVLTVTGNSAALITSIQLQLSADLGMFVLTGSTVALTKAGAARRRNVLIF